MNINKHGSFYMRNGWGQKIIYAIKEDEMIFSPSNEQKAVDEIGLGRVMIKALRYWSTVFGLTFEAKMPNGIKQIPTQLFLTIDKYDPYFQQRGTLLLMQRNIARNKENATAWYWAFNEMETSAFDKETFVTGLYSYLAVNGLKIKKDAVEKEFNCFKNTYINEKRITIKNAIDEDPAPFFSSMQILKINDDKKIQKRFLTKSEMPMYVLLYSIAMDNLQESQGQGQIGLDKLIEDKMQVGRYFNLKYSTLVEVLLEAENKKLITLNNNFGNSYLEFLDVNYEDIISKYYESGDR